MRTIKPHGERKIVPLDEALRRVEGYEKPERAPEQQEADDKREVMLQIGLRSFDVGIKTVLWTYGESLNLLNQAGYNRHFSPEEYFSILTNTAPQPQTLYPGVKISEEVPSHLSESERCWLSMAWRLDGDVLGCYTDPKGLKFYQEGDYYMITDSLEYSNMREFYVPSMLKKRGDNETYPFSWSDVPLELSEFLFGSKERKTFQKMKEEDFKIVLPSDSDIWPVSVKCPVEYLPYEKKKKCRRILLESSKRACSRAMKMYIQ